MKMPPSHPSNPPKIPSLLKSTLALSLLLLLSLLLYTLHFPTPNPNPNPTTSWWSSSTPPLPCPTSLSHIVFGIAGSASTWNHRQHYSHLWYTPNCTRASIWLDTPPNYTWPIHSPPYSISTIASLTASDRIARIFKGALQEAKASSSEVRWVVLGDDDTVFFVENLIGVLSRYDYREMWYVGGVSESVEQNEAHSYLTAYGGGGFAMSYALAERLAGMIEDCLVSYAAYYGSDEKVSSCVAELGVPLTKEPGFHQLDIRDDPYGLLAAHPVAPLVSLHHLDALKPLFPRQTRLESLQTLHKAYTLDPSRILQQTICYSHTKNWSVSVSWGYTVQLYPSLVPSRALELPLRTFRSWTSWSNGPFMFNTRPLNPDPNENPILFFLDRVVDQSNNTLSTYNRVDPQTRFLVTQPAYKYAMGSVRKITVTAPKMDPSVWMKAPRRQCCEIGDVWRLTRTMEINVRSCKLGETITP